MTYLLIGLWVFTGLFYENKIAKNEKKIKELNNQIAADLKELQDEIEKIKEEIGYVNFADEN